MKILGKYSGRIFELDEKDKMEECGTQISDEQANDEEWVNNHHIQDLLYCITCNGCPLSQK